MSVPIIPTLPAAPLPSDSKTQFNAKAYPFVAALNPFGQQINAFGEYLTPTGAATLPLAGTETVTIEQGGERKTLEVSALGMPEGAATLPLAGTETVVVFQGGEYRTAPVSEIGSGGGGGGGDGNPNILSKYTEDDLGLVNFTFTGNQGLRSDSASGASVSIDTRTPGDFVAGDVIAFDFVNTDEVTDNFSIMFVRLGQFEVINLAQSGDAVTKRYTKMTVFLEIPEDLTSSDPFNLVFFQNYNSFNFIVTGIYKI